MVSIFIILTVSSANTDMYEKNFLEMQESEKDFLHVLEMEKEKREKKKLLERSLIEEKERIAKEEQLRLVKKKIKELEEKKEAREKYQKEIEVYLAQKEKEREEKARVEKEKKLKKKLARKYIYAKIDISSQRMMVYKGSKHLYTWKVSTGKNGYHTPRGNYKPTYMTRMHYSKQYYNSPMPYSIFFKGGYAIHGTTSVSRLGRRASHGCVRLLTSNAKKLYRLVRKFGKYNTKIQIVN